ncbi:MAG: serine hydroxymethyltransferase [Acidimicrobiia bacterium]|nr:serine hydroxymethyltransferase [Acidimicrobiia bacterium]
MTDHFTSPLADVDPEIFDALTAETDRQRHGVELIASENLVSRATLDAIGSPMVNKTVEGYPGGRYYGGAEHADRIETLAVARAKELFGAAYANVQPHSGSQANLAVFLAFLQPGDTVLSMDLSAGGHLSHGASPNISGKWMNAVHYGVDEDGLLDYDDLATTADREQPKLIIAGGSAYPREIDFAQFRSVADKVGATLLIDMAHWAGQVAAGVHPSPLPYADVVTATTYKNLRGVRGGFILSHRDDLARKLDAAVFPGVQGSVILNSVAAKAVCFREAMTEEFRTYARNVVDNARSLAASLVDRGITVLTGGTDTPLMLLDLRPLGLTGAAASDALEAVGLTANKNGVPNDPQPPKITSGLRLGTSAGTARGFGTGDFTTLGGWIADVLLDMAAGDATFDRHAIAASVRTMTERHPIY